MHVPLEQASPGQHSPQLPPQPSGPHCLPTQLGAHSHCPVALQVEPEAQAPQLPPQPSGPHCLPEHCGVHAPVHRPSAEQVC